MRNGYRDFKADCFIIRVSYFVHNQGIITVKGLSVLLTVMPGICSPGNIKTKQMSKFANLSTFLVVQCERFGVLCTDMWNNTTFLIAPELYNQQCSQKGLACLGMNESPSEELTSHISI